MSLAWLVLSESSQGVILGLEIGDVSIITCHWVEGVPEKSLILGVGVRQHLPLGVGWAWEQSVFKSSLCVHKHLGLGIGWEFSQ